MQMSAFALPRRDLAQRYDLLVSMHRLRARVFKGRLDWDVTLAGDMEIDAFDAADPIYILVVAGEHEVVGHARLLPTTGPNMLADTFPFLLEGREAPCGPDVVESSRFCVDTSLAVDLAGHGLRQATSLLLAAILDWSLAAGQRSIATVTDTRMERILRRAGWPLERLGCVHDIDGTQALAGLLPVTREHLAVIRKSIAPTPSLAPTRSKRQGEAFPTRRIAA